MAEDKRIHNLIEQILSYAGSDYQKRGKVSKKGDEIDALIAGINVLGEELKIKEEIQRDKERRKEALIEILLKYTMLDFSTKANISDKGDEIDAIAAGLNAMSDEIIFHQEELDKQSEQLMATNKELESFTYSVSHDLRAPLRAVHGFSQILAEEYADVLDSEGQRILRSVMQNATKMGKLIDNLLAYSRMGKKEFKKIKIDIEKLIKSVVQQIDDSQKHQAEIIIHPMAPLYGDYTLLSLVFQNLVSNAIKYSSKKENPVIEIGETEIKDKKVYYVKDNGAGFNMAYYDKLFGVFQRLHRDEEFDGTGVGLAIVQRIILRHGGTIWAEGKVGEGATFYFTVG